MPLLVPLCNTIHREVRRGEGVIYLLPYLKVLLRYAGSNNDFKLCWLRIILLHHVLQGVLCDTLHRPPPPCMGCSYGVMSGVVEENRDAIGSVHTNANITTIGNDGIFPFFLFCLLSL